MTAKEDLKDKGKVWRGGASRVARGAFGLFRMLVVVIVDRGWCLLLLGMSCIITEQRSLLRHFCFC